MEACRDCVARFDQDKKQRWKTSLTKAPHQVCILVIPRIYRFVTFCCMWLPFGFFLWPKVAFSVASVPPFIICFFLLLRKSTNYPQILQSTFKLHQERKTVPTITGVHAPEWSAQVPIGLFCCQFSFSLDHLKDLMT